MCLKNALKDPQALEKSEESKQMPKYEMSTQLDSLQLNFKSRAAICDINYFMQAETLQCNLYL